MKVMASIDSRNRLKNNLCVIFWASLFFLYKTRQTMNLCEDKFFCSKSVKIFSRFIYFQIYLWIGLYICMPDSLDIQMSSYTEKTGYELSQSSVKPPQFDRWLTDWKLKNPILFQSVNTLNGLIQCVHLTRKGFRWQQTWMQLLSKRNKQLFNIIHMFKTKSEGVQRYQKLFYWEIKTKTKDFFCYNLVSFFYNSNKIIALTVSVAPDFDLALTDTYW